jgi:hypothetical protein
VVKIIEAVANNDIYEPISGGKKMRKKSAEKTYRVQMGLRLVLGIIYNKTFGEFQNSSRRPG